MVKKIFFFLLSAMSFLMSSAEEIYINAKTGNDINIGTKLQPLKTIGEAAKRINVNTKREAATIILSEGVYPLTETILFDNNKFSG